MHYHCKDCDWEIQGYSNIIHEILDHEKKHYKEKEIVEKVDIKDCPECNGTGKIEERYLLERNKDEIPEAD